MSRVLFFVWREKERERGKETAMLMWLEGLKE